MADEQEQSPYRVAPEWGFEVYRNERNRIVIKQEDVYGDEPDIVEVSAERVGKLIEFLEAVRDEILTDRADAASEANVVPLKPSYRPGMDP